MVISMYLNYKFCALSWIIVFHFAENTAIKGGVKIWKPNNNIFDKSNWVDPDLSDDCGKVEFADVNTADIIIDKLTAKEFVLPITGDLLLLDNGYLEVVSKNSKKKTSCLKLKQINWHRYDDPENWESDVSDNVAVPDVEKLPCRYDKTKFPNHMYSGVWVGERKYLIETVSSLQYGNETFNDRGPFSLHSYAGNPELVLNNFDSLYGRIYISKRICYDPSGCTCRRYHNILCPPERKIECLSPVDPLGFCHKICGAFMSITPASGFSLSRIKNALKEYPDVDSYVSKAAENLIQVVFAEKQYSGDSVEYAKKFYEKLQENLKEYKIEKIYDFQISGQQTSGGTSVWTVLLASLIFVIGLFGIIFYVYGDYKMPVGLRLRSASTLPLSATYRARFSSKDDESGLIFDNQSMIGSIMNLNQSFDNPMYGEVSTRPDLGEVAEDFVSEAIPVTENKQRKTTDGDILQDLTRLNNDLKKEMGSSIIEELPENLQPQFSSSNNEVPPLLELEEDGEIEEI